MYMKKKIIIALIIVLLAFVTLIVALKWNDQDCDSMAKLFAENKEAFQNAATIMLNQHCDEGMRILAEDPKNDRVTVVQIGSLYFETTNRRYPNEVYEELYAALEPLFEKKFVDGIAFDSIHIQFCVRLYMGEEASIIYTTDGKPGGSFPTIEEQRMLEENWYAFVCHD